MSKPTRKSSPERRREIALMALRIISEQGLTSLSTATLAAALGVSSGAPFKHFASWDEIYREMVAIGLERIEATFPDENLPGIERLFQLTRQRIVAIQSIPGLAWLLRSEQAYLTLPVDSVEALQEVAKRSQKFLLAAITQAMEAGEIRNDIGAKETLVIVSGTIHGLSGKKASTNSKEIQSMDDVLAALKTILTPANTPQV